MCKIAQKPDIKPLYELQDIFNLYANDYILKNKLTSVQKRAITDIKHCRTSALGYNAKECCDCKNIEFSYYANKSSDTVFGETSISKRWSYNKKKNKRL